jgi:imidazolonepropionase-like amidohydrolase
MRKLKFMFLSLFVSFIIQAQETFPVNGVADKRDGHYAFTNATIVKDASTTLTKATLIIKDGNIVNVGTNIPIPNDAIVIDCKDKYIYPSFIDIYSDYGVTAPTRQQPTSIAAFFASQQAAPSTKGGFGWNPAIKAETDASKLFNSDESKAKALRDIGFGTVLTHQKDGIARGTGVVVTLANRVDNLVILKPKATAHYSFNKGASSLSYPSSMMGSIALLRQTYLDAQWYKSNPKAEGVNLSLQSWNEIQNLPQIFDAGDKWNVLRADRIAKEFGTQYILKAGGNEYQRIKEMASIKASFILPLNFPDPMDVDDPIEIRFVGLDDLKHWELAPTNPAAFEKAGIQFCLTTSDLSNPSVFMANLRKAIEHGLSEKMAIDALTKNPATLLGMFEKVGSLESGKLANFIITSGELFNEKTVVHQNWIQGNKYAVKEESWFNVKGNYTLNINTANGEQTYSVDMKDAGVATFIAKDTLTGKYSYDGKLVKLSFTEGRGPMAKETTMSGVANSTNWNGAGRDANGNVFTWTANLNSLAASKTDSVAKKMPLQLGKVTYPFLGYGVEEMQKQENLLIKNATVWTNEKEGKLEGADVLIKNGKISAVGKNISDATAKVIDASGKHVTAGIIDEHSHIAAASINEGGQSVTSEVRIQDNLNPDDINIYRQLSGGVTSSHILHGSANTIGGQTQLIKLRWGANDDELKFKGSDGFIKFALGENVKRSSNTQGNTRFPDSRMGVEQVLDDAFSRAKDYEAQLKGPNGKNVRRDLELDALVEIMNKKRFITCHSYVQSEITATMRIAEKYGFKVNTFTHILEGYKVADKMKQHGVAASTFSDWWAYKMEVQDAIAYNAAIMTKVGLNVAINSDDAEMARRLNQEAAKSIKYGNLSEEEALKMVTINPAKMLHVDDKVGSIKVGKDADIVIWSNNPVSIYAKAETTIVDGIVYFDRAKDLEMRKKIQDEKTRLIKKLAAAKRAPSGPGGMPANFQRPRPRYEVVQRCTEETHKHSLLEVEEEINEQQ